MLHSKMYKQYYPIKNKWDIKDMNYDELKTLCRWIEKIKIETEVRNIESAKRSARNGLRFYRHLAFNYNKPLLDLVNEISNQQFANLDSEDMELINAVLYRHKYNFFISQFVFPTVPKGTLLYSENKVETARSEPAKPV